MMKDAKIYLLKRSGTFQKAAREIGIDNSALSVILNGLRKPTRTEREKLRKFMGYYFFKKFFAPKPVVRVGGDEAING